MSIQSVTKAFTAVSILILSDRGRLDLEDPVSRYLTNLPYGEVTIRQLMNMTSGLPRFVPTLMNFADTTQTLENDELIKLIALHKPKANPPGQSFNYNTDNYVLLASVVERLSGQSFARFVHQNIFEPLNMKNSYVEEGGVSGEGNIYSTAKDLFVFEQALYSDSLLSKDLIQKSFDFTILEDGSTSNYGFAWRIFEQENHKEAYIVGDGENVRASIQRFMIKGKTFIYLHNNSGANWESVYQVVRNIWEGKAYTLPEKRRIYPIDKKLLKKYVGQYLTKTFGLLHITEENGKLYLRPDPIPGKEELVPSSDRTFFFANQAVEWEFFLDEDGGVLGLGLKGKPGTMGPKKNE